jgi:hypothetical protein
MSLFGNIGNFVGDSLGEFASHPWQAAGALLGVPGYDPFFGGLFNNRPGGALISPTGNFTSSAWQDMYNRNPGDAGALNMFNGINSVADKVAPAIAGFYAGPALSAATSSMGGGAGAAAGSAGLGGTAGAMGASGAAGAAGAGSLGSAGSMGLLGTGGMYGSAAAANAAAAPSIASSMGGGLLGTGGMYGAVPVNTAAFGGSGVFGGSAAPAISGMPSAGGSMFSDGGSFLTNGTGGMNWANIGQQMMKTGMNGQQQQQQQQQPSFIQSKPPVFGNPAVRNPAIGPQMTYAQFGGNSVPDQIRPMSFNQFGSAYA